MLGLFGIFGRSRELQRLDEALRAAGLHPRLVPDAVKLAARKLVLDGHGALDEEACRWTAELLAFCLLGAQGYAEANGLPPTEAVEARIADAIDAGESLDAKLVLLTLHAGLTQADVVRRFGLEAVTGAEP